MSAVIPPAVPMTLPPAMSSALLPDADKAARHAELQARIQSKLATVGLGLGSVTATPQSGYLRLLNYFVVLCVIFKFFYLILTFCVVG